MLIFPDGEFDDRNYLKYIEDEMVEIYDPKFRTIQLQGYNLECLDSGTAHEYAHYFCGPHDVAGAICPNCRKPFLRLLSIDTKDPRLGVTECPFPFISLFFCVTCELGLYDFYYQLLPPEGKVLLIRYAEGILAPNNIPFYPEQYPGYFPGTPVQLIPLTLEQQWYIITEKKLLKAYAIAKQTPRNNEIEFIAYQKELEAYQCWKNFYIYEQYEQYAPSTQQIGGIPDLVQAWEDWPSQCPLCGQPMMFLAAFGNESTDPRGFVDDISAQFTFTFCNTCYVVGAACL